MSKTTDPLAFFWISQTVDQSERPITGRINCVSRLKQPHPVSKDIRNTMRLSDLDKPRINSVKH